MGYTLETIKISQHAKERYAERIMERDNKTDITTFIAHHEAKIKEDIFKMVEYGELIYTGKSLNEFNKSIVDVFLNGTWVIIADPNRKSIVTLYTIDLGVGKEFNEAYISKLKENLNVAKENYESVVGAIESQTSHYYSIIEENLDQINEYKKIIKDLEKLNEAYNEVIKSLEVDKTIAEREVREIVGTMIGKSIF